MIKEEYQSSNHIWNNCGILEVRGRKGETVRRVKANPFSLLCVTQTSKRPLLDSGMYFAESEACRF